MNNTLDIKRLARLIIYENKSSKFLLYIVAAILIYTIVCVFMRSFNDIALYSSIIGERFMEKLLCFSPILCYYKLMIGKEKRTLYPTLPASSTEKYLSMFMNTLVIAPATIIVLATVINHIGSLIYTADNYAGNETDIQPYSLLYVLVTWSWISCTTFLLLVFTQFRNWKGIAIALAIPAADIALAAILIGTVDGEFVSPTTMARFMNIISVANLFVFQALIYLMIKRIKA
ncbi:MAG: hypothetical protein IJX41_06660 [Bacteroidaceae bacterium]|nr:hypothetical protein [Bacteroidaceae bacterium]